MPNLIDAATRPVSVLSEEHPRALRWTTSKMVLACLLVLCVVIRSAAELTRPLGQDLGIFYWVADVILDGGIPYRNAWELKGPGLLYFVAIIEWIFGQALWSLRVVDLLLTGIGATLLYQLARQSTGRITLWPVLLYYAWYSSLDYENAGQPDAWVGIILAASVALVLRARSASLRSFFLHGLLIGVAICFKPVYGLMALVTLIALWQYFRAAKLRAALVAGVMAFLGAAVPLGIVLFWFSKHGALHDLLEANILYTTQVYAPGSLAYKLWLFGRNLIGNSSVAVTVLVSLIPFARAIRERRPEYAVLGGWLICTSAIVAIQAKYWPYHSIPFYIALAVPGGIGIRDIGGRVARSTARWVPVRAKTLGLAAALMMFAVCAGPEVARSLRTAFTWLAAQVDDSARTSYDAQFGVYGYGANTVHALASDVRARTAPIDKVVYWGNSALLYALMDRPSPVRFGFNWTLVRRPGNPYYVRWRAEYMEAVSRARPRLIIGRSPAMCVGGSSDLECLSLFPELWQYVLAYYHPVATVGALTIFERVQHAPLAGVGQ